MSTITTATPTSEQVVILYNDRYSIRSKIVERLNKEAAENAQNINCVVLGMDWQSWNPKDPHSKAGMGNHRYDVVDLPVGSCKPSAKLYIDPHRLPSFLADEKAVFKSFDPENLIGEKLNDLHLCSFRVKIAVYRPVPYHPSKRSYNYEWGEEVYRRITWTIQIPPNEMTEKLERGSAWIAARLNNCPMTAKK